MKLITRKEAQQQGLTRYFTGRPCPKGHIAERRTANKGCQLCTKRRRKEYIASERGKLVDRAISARYKKKFRNTYGQAYNTHYRKKNTSVEFWLKYRMHIYMHNRLRQWVKEGRNVPMFDDLVGCTSDKLRIYLESLFQPGMSWENHGQGSGFWNIDHKIPLSVFSKSAADQRKAWNFKNLQPLWHEDNLRKGAKVNYAL